MAFAVREDELDNAQPVRQPSSAVDRILGSATLRLLSIGLTGLFLVFAALEASIVLPPASANGVTLGMDFAIYQERAASWLAGDGFYHAYQLNGPYVVGEGAPPALYPPPLLYVLVPSLVLPAVVWWVVPIGIIVASLWRMRPPIWTWPILAAVLCYPRTWIVLVYGNPSLWALAALAAGLVWTWPLAMVPIKPTLAPFALLGIRSRVFWVGVAIAVAASIPFGAMWIDYVTAMSNARNGLGLEYLVGELPIALALVIASLGRRWPTVRPVTNRNTGSAAGPRNRR
jgi:hypothetical protein